ncbi:MAG: CoA ester lyase [Clostridia bacterium]|nr:CoA ester lyase [Clostridia bacterium]
MNRMRSMLFSPANNPKMYLKAPIFKPDCILFDLEDSVAFTEKDAARDLLCEAVKVLDFGSSDVCVRVNSLRTPFCEKDIKAIVPAGIRFIRLAMCESRDDVVQISQMLSEAEKENGIEEGSVKVQCSIETVKGVLNARDTVSGSDRVVSLSFGAEDYTRSLGTKRTREGRELMYARMYLPVVAAERGISAIDTVWSAIEDMEGLADEAALAANYGFTGKSCIHPNQIEVIHSAFMPTAEDVEHARKVIAALEDAKAKGEGVFVVDGKMVDEPVIQRARKVLMQIGE